MKIFYKYPIFLSRDTQIKCTPRGFFYKYKYRDFAGISMIEALISINEKIREIIKISIKLHKDAYIKYSSPVIHTIDELTTVGFIHINIEIVLVHQQQWRSYQLMKILLMFYLSTFSDDKMQKMFKDEHVSLLF